MNKTDTLNTKKFLQDAILPLLNLLIISAAIIFICSRDFPYIGHDYSYFIPRMLDAYLHQKINGLEIQWYTPSFGGGLPVYPNPQDIQYSLPQMFMLVLNPWVSLMLAIFIYSSIGFISFYYLLINEYGFNKKAGVLGATLIVANGFYLEHAIVGHVGFQTFPLFGMILYLMLSKKFNPLHSGIFLGALVTLIIYNAGFFILFTFALSLTIILPMTALMSPQVINWKRFLTTSITGAVIFLLLSASKLSAIYSFMRFFPREVNDVYGKTYLQGILGIVAQLAGCGIMIPYYLLTGKGLSEISVFFQQATGAIYSTWETDISISPVLFLLIIFGIIKAIQSIPKISKDKFSREKFIAFVFLLLGIWLVTDFSLAQGVLYNLIKPLPIIKSLHVNVRFTAAFIFPLSLLGAYILNGFIEENKRLSQAEFFIINLLTVSFLFFYLILPAQEFHRGFNIKVSMKVYSKIEKGETYPIQNIAASKDKSVFINESSDIGNLYEAIFGYGLESFKPELHAGSIYDVKDGYYNMTNPSSYVFPKENNLRLFERFRVDQKESLELFANHRQPVFNISTVQKIANTLSMVTWIALCLYLVFKIWQSNKWTGRAPQTSEVYQNFATQTH